MKQKKCTYVITETIILALIAVLAFTVLNNEYLFGWAAHNWKFYLFLAGIALLPIIWDKRLLSALITTGIVVGIFAGNYIGSLIKVLNEAKIVEGMRAEQVYRLRHHPGFEIWICAIILFAVIGFIVETIDTRKYPPKRALKAAIGPSLGTVLGGVIIPRLIYPYRYNDTYPPLLIHACQWFLVGYAVSFLVILIFEWAKSKIEGS